MNYFTPELFVAFKSSEPKVARAAAIEWDKAVAAYDKHLKSVRRRLPPPVRELSNLLLLHDAELLNFEEVSPNGRSAIAHLLVRQFGEVSFLSYFLLEKPSIAKPIKHTDFSPRAVHWLYDEIDLRGPGGFSHEILFSDGRVFRVRFEHLSILSAVALVPQLAAKSGPSTDCA